MIRGLIEVYGQEIRQPDDPSSRQLTRDDGTRIEAGHVVIAAGAWSPSVRGLPRAGFDATTTSAAIDGLATAARSLCPVIASAPIVRTWAGFRPATPDMLPNIGRDPDASQLLYACGHSTNGILPAPATARALVALVQGRPTEWDLSPFSITGLAPPERGLWH